MPTAEQHARATIDALLTAAGWAVQDVSATNIHASHGVAIREFPLEAGYGFADYLLYIDGKAAGVIEAKKEGTTLIGVETQSEKYIKGLPENLPRWASVKDGDARDLQIKKGKIWNPSKIDFEKLRKDFKATEYKNIEIADLRAFVERKLDQMLQHNRTRTDFAQRMQQIIDTYNAGGTSTENYFDEQMKFTLDLKSEDERSIREGWTEEELELFDLLKKNKMTIEETKKVKLPAKALLHRLREEPPKVLVQDWYKDTQSKKVVRAAVEQVLDQNLPESFDRVVFKEKCNNVFELMIDYAAQGRKWAA